MSNSHAAQSRWPALMSVENVAAYLDCSTRLVEQWRAMSLMPAPVKLPNETRLTRWRREDIDAFLSQLPAGK